MATSDFFLIESTFQPTWIKFRASIYCNSSLTPYLYFNFGGGFSETFSVRMTPSRNNEFEAVVKLPRTVAGVRIEPMPTDKGASALLREFSGTEVQRPELLSRLATHAFRVFANDPVGFFAKVPTYLGALNKPFFLKLAEPEKTGRRAEVTIPPHKHKKRARGLFRGDIKRALKVADSDQAPQRRIDIDGVQKVGDFTVITPTGDRHVAFNKCVQWITTQTLRPDQWIVVDDGTSPVTDFIRLPSWTTYVRRTRTDADAKHTLSDNIKASIEHIKNDKVVIMEDDDWYSASYLATITPHLENSDLVGFNEIFYYHPFGRVWKTGMPERHTAFAQTAFTRGAIPTLIEVCNSRSTDVRDQGLIDRFFWHDFKGPSKLISLDEPVHLGIKGGFGRMGLAEGHNHDSWGYQDDEHLEFFRSFLGSESSFFNQLTERPKSKWVIYTAISGDYDSLKEPLFQNDLFDFVVFSDRPLFSDRWTWMPLDFLHMDPVREAKRPKILPHIYLPQYEWSVWVDANIFITGDLSYYVNKCIDENKEIGLFRHPEREGIFDEAKACVEKSLDRDEIIDRQVERYTAEGAPNLPLYECNFIVRRHNDPDVIPVMNRWWSEIDDGSRRDQISFPYAAWRESADIALLGARGQSVRTTDRLFYVRHGDAQVEEYRERIDRHRRLYERKAT